MRRTRPWPRGRTAAAMAAVRACPDEAPATWRRSLRKPCTGSFRSPNSRGTASHMSARRSPRPACAARPPRRPGCRPERRTGARSPGSRPSLSVTLAIGITSKPTFDPAPVRHAAADTICGRSGHSPLGRRCIKIRSACSRWAITKADQAVNYANVPVEKPRAYPPLSACFTGRRPSLVTQHRTGRSVAPREPAGERILAVPWVVSWIASAECKTLGLFLSLPDCRTAGLPGCCRAVRLASCCCPLDVEPGSAVGPQLRRPGRMLY
jgi:hypothetical protein